MSISGNIRTLHVDDDPSLGDLTADFLERERDDLEVVTEMRPSEAIERLERETDSIDCIVSDYEMPGMDGLEFLEAVREIDEELPFILFTGKGSEEIAAEAITAGVTDYLQKGGTEQYVVLANRVVNSVEQYKAAQIERRLRTLSEETDDMLWMFSADWETLLFVNSAVEDVLGVSRSQLSDDPRQLFESIHPDDRRTLERALDRLSNGEPIDLEHRVVRDDNHRWVWVQAKPLFDDRESVDRVVGLTRDITERKERELHLQKAQEVGNLGWWKKEIPSDKIYWSEQVVKMWGVNGQGRTLDHDRFLEYLHPDDQEPVNEAWKAALEGEQYDIEHRIITGSGDLRWMREKAEFEYDEDGSPIRAVGVVQDITERKERERELQRARERYQSLFENNPLLLWEEDFSAAKAYAEQLADRTDDFETYLAGHPEELRRILEKIDVIDVNQNAVDYYRADTKDDLLENICRLQTDESMETNRRMWSAIVEGETEFSGETVAKRFDGTIRRQLIDMKVPEAYADDYSRVYITATDITDHE